MAQIKPVRGPRSSVLWLVIILVLVLAIALAWVAFVIGPERQFAVQATATAQAAVSQATATAQAHASEVQRAYDAGVAFAEAGDWEKAAEEFARVVSLDPGYKDATARLAETRTNVDAAKAKAAAEAIAIAEQTATTAAAEIRLAIESAYDRGLAYLDLERWEQAKAEFEQVIVGDPNYKDIQAKLAEVEAKLAEIRALTPTATPTITPGPSPTPLPTPTNTPTTTPTNTPTPAPTATPTSTPTSTSTPRPTNTPTPVPTNTRRPTNTPIPTPTPIPDTAPGTILKEGQTWYQNGLALTAKDFCIIYCLPEEFGATFVLESFLDKEILLPDISGNDVVLTFDTGETYLPYSDPTNPYTRAVSKIDSQPLKPHNPIEWTWKIHKPWGSPSIGANTRSFVLTVKRIGDRIHEAKWAGEIPR